MEKKKGYDKLLTVPEKLGRYENLFLTGNEYLALPHITPAGGIMSLNVLRLDCRGILEFGGSEEKPLIAPFLTVNSKTMQANFDNFTYGYQADWIPVFSVTGPEGYTLEGEILTPPGYKGFCYMLRLRNNSNQSIDVELGWQGYWSSFNYLVFNRRETEAKKILQFNSWTGSLVLEASAGLPLSAAAFATEQGSEWVYSQENGSFQNSESFALAPGEECSAILYAAVNLESDGAATTTIDLRRHGYEELKLSTLNWLAGRRLKDDDPAIEEIMNRNLLFCYFYAFGRCLESEALVPVTSRSPRYYVGAAFWSRDSLLWAFPAVLAADRDLAREIIVTVYSRHISNAGDHAHYINGTLLYPGFELDQLAAYVLALKSYLFETEDYGLLDLEVISSGLTRVAEKALEQFEPEAGLYSTFLDPSDDPVIYPFLTYNNALLQRAFAFLGELQATERWSSKADFAILARELTHAIYEHCMVKGPVGTMFAWSVDGRGKFFLYDNPPGSLQLLAHYGFCPADETVFKNTVRWIRSSNNSYFLHGGSFEEAGSIHASNPWPLAACNDLLACNAGAIDFLKRAELDNGFFCETVDPETGRVSTGAAFASGAGFLAYALKNRVKESECREVERDVETKTENP
jgi:uncharacterized protein